MIGKLMGKGSSLPGKIALKIYPNVLAHLQLPEHVIAVTGSNGKTSTAELIAHALKASGKSVGWNHEGSNQIEGVATLLLRVAALSGKVKKDALVLECDERYARQIFTYIKPSALLITNLCRDQLTRNGHHEFVLDYIQRAVDEAGSETTLVLNADDPYVSTLGVQEAALENDGDGAIKLDANIIWFGACADFGTSHFEIEATPRYDDGAFCPVCKSEMKYDFRIAGNYGAFCCNSCPFKRQVPDFEVTKLDYESGMMEITGNVTSRAAQSLHATSLIKTHLVLPGLIGAYNVVAAIAAVSTTGVSAQTAASAIDGYMLKGGRTVHFLIQAREGTLLISKHENSLAYDQSLTWAVRQKKPCTLVILVNDISRKYYTSETSWLWDIDFEIANHAMVEHIVLAGRYVSELAARFALTGIDQSKIGYVADIDALRTYIEKNTSGAIYVLTCFSDKAKLLEGLGLGK